MGKKDVAVPVPAGAADAAVAVQAPACVPEPEGGWPVDEFTGVGGSYVRDPLTGVRRPVPVVAE